MKTDTSSSSLSELQRHYRLLQSEYEYEKENYLQKSSSGGLFRKIQQGLCRWPLTAGRSYYNSQNQAVIEVQWEQEEETEHNFEYGRPVRFFSVDNGGNQQFFNFTCTISYVQNNRMIVVLSHASLAALLQQTSSLGVQLWFDETTYKAMFSSLTQVAGARNNRLAELREILSGEEPPRSCPVFPVRFPWLNSKQEEAVNHVLTARDTAIIHGPPGTGKTTTLVEAIYEILRRENQVLVCAQSNTAVDWISEKLTDRGINVLRIGNPTRVNDKMLSFTYERRFEAHPSYPALWSMRKNLREINLLLRNKPKSEQHQLRDRQIQLRQRITETEIKIHQDLFGEARVIASTLTGAANRLLAGQHFSTLFIDEAAQALEAACWIAITKANRVIFAGDHCQLPPTVKCQEAAQGGLADTLMQKIARRKPETVSLLETQYRMNETIMKFPSQWFYHNRLEAAPEVRDRKISAYDTPLVWYDTAGLPLQEEQWGEGQSRLNKTEARLMTGILKNYMQNIGQTRIQEEHIDFGLISPYKAQVSYIRRLIRNDSFFRPFRSQIRINTVDGFQGQECDVIFISLVRANTEGRIGFLSDLRRMNVAITRARMKLMLSGDSSTLTRHHFYRSLYEYTATNGTLISLSPSTSPE